MDGRTEREDEKRNTHTHTPLATLPHENDGVGHTRARKIANGQMQEVCGTGRLEPTLRLGLKYTYQGTNCTKTWIFLVRSVAVPDIKLGHLL